MRTKNGVIALMRASCSCLAACALALMLVPRAGAQGAFGSGGMSVQDPQAVAEPPLQQALKLALGKLNERDDSQGGIADACFGDGANLFYPFVDDGSWILTLDANDDGSSGAIGLGFTFDFFTELFTTAFVNNNGNITLSESHGGFSSSGFPFQGSKMIAPFWADVDTRPQESGKVWRKHIDSNGDGSIDTMVVTWDNVGYFNSHTDKRNSFQVILTSGVNPRLAPGATVAFSYDNMCWTTGDASKGSGGFGGVPATVGVNRGNGVNFFQVGRFGEPGGNYDGPTGNPDGIDFLDGKFLQFALVENVPPICTNLPPSGTITAVVGVPLDFTLNFIGPESDQTVSTIVENAQALLVRGFAFTAVSGSPASLRIQWTPQPIDIGQTSIAIVAQDNALQPAQTNLSLTVLVGVGVPTNVAASDGTSTAGVIVTWSAVAGATGYDIFRSESEIPLGTVEAVLSFTDTTAVPGTLYSYSVAARTAAGSGVQSSSDSGYRNLTAPTNVACSSGLPDGVTISWTASVGAVSYHIRRNGSVIATTDASPYNDLTAVIGVNALYSLKAVGVVGVSAASPSVVGWRAPIAPTNVAASDGTSTAGVIVSWSAVAGATSYKVYRDGAATAIATVIAPTFTDTMTVAGTPYSYVVRASAAAGLSAPSSADVGYRNIQAPSGIIASDGTSTAHVALTWLASTGAVGYQVLRSGSADPIATVGAVTSFNDTTAVAGTSYGYSVRAVSPAGPSAASASDAGYRNLVAPTSVAASDGTFTDRVVISWIAPIGAVAYQVFRGGTTAAIASGITATTYADMTAVVGTSYMYTVKATGTAIGSLSAASVGDAGYRNLIAPTSVAASDGISTARVAVTWVASASAMGYKIFRDGAVTAIGTVGAVLVYNDATAVAGTSYVYTVKAIGAAIGSLSAASAGDAGYRNLIAPTKVAASDGTSTAHVAVIWAASASATGYKILRANGTAAPAEVGTVGAVFIYNDTTAVAGTSYIYTVKASGAAIGSLSAASVGNAGYKQLSAPTNVAASDGTSTAHVAVTWSASSGATGYKVFRNGAVTAIGTVGAVLLYNDMTAAAGTSYSYTVKASGAATGSLSLASAGNAGYRNRAAPTNVVATDNDPAKVRVTWIAAASGAPAVTGYEVWRQIGEASATLLGSTVPTVLIFDDTSIGSGIIALYSVKAKYVLIGSSPATTVTTLAASDTGIRPSGFAGGGDGGVSGGGEESANGGGEGGGESDGSDGSDGSGGSRVNPSDSPGESSQPASGATEESPAQLVDPIDLCTESTRKLSHEIESLEHQLARGNLDENQRAVTKILAARMHALLERVAVVAGQSAEQPAHELAVCAMARGDVNLDGAINDDDLVAFLQSWAAHDQVGADLDRDGLITARDMTMVLSAIEAEQGNKPTTKR